jgi:predicted alpha/beta-fold hydrolase
MPAQMKYEQFKKMRTFKEFDDVYTGPVHGFLNAEDYWARCSSRRFVSKITIPTLLMSALDDPFLGKECYPVEEAKKSEYFFLELPENGGHVGFVSFNPSGEYWHERRAVSFISNAETA